MARTVGKGEEQLASKKPLGKGEKPLEKGEEPLGKGEEPLKKMRNR